MLIYPALADDDAVQTFLLQKSTLIDFIQGGCLRCTCGGRVTHTHTSYEYTAGRFTFQCTNKACKKTISYDTQRQGEAKGYVLNDYLIGSNYMNCNDLTRLNNMLSTLKAATLSESYYNGVVKSLNPVLETTAQESVNQAMQEFNQQTSKDCEGDGRFNKSRDAKFCTFPVINQANNKLISCDTADVREEVPGANAWKAEDYLGGQFFKKLEAQKIELDNWIHDACRQMSKRLDEHKAAFSKLNKEGKLTTYKGDSKDHNDTWHSNQSFAKLWNKAIEIGTKSVKRSTKGGRKKESKTTIEWKQIAETQLRSVSKRVKQAFMQVTGSVHKTYGNTLTYDEKADKMVDTLGQMLLKCLVHNDHSMCKRVCGETCPCVVGADLANYFNSTMQCQLCNDSWADLPTAMSHKPEYNMYKIDQDMKDYFEELGSETNNQIEEPSIQSMADELDAVCDHDAAQQTETNADAGESEDGWEATDTLEGMAAVDPFWTNRQTLTHPLAIDTLLTFLNSKRLHAIVSKNQNCYSTSMVESFNSLVTVYAPKRRSYRVGMKARVGMAILDWNENIGRLQHETQNGRRYTKHREKTYSWQQTALDRVFGRTLW